ncbi:MAG: type II toxin-antitoxin system VapC family toxin [Magnetococcales bacterium]|nr:type II toxin-antitoxin system VapC family toxin [Magnetococcales bacterium]MBF0165688.1 type II toxin-antitoxin system VapC family toxin [Magnetococcales bacterium]
MLIDTNLIIYSVHPDYPRLRRWLVGQCPACSVISRVEALGYHRLSVAGRRSIEAVLDHLDILYPTMETFEKAIHLRQQRKISLGDALIAATAWEHRQTLATVNVEDFRWITDLTVINPLETPA